MSDTSTDDTERSDIQKLTDKSANITNITGVSANLDDGGPELARCVISTTNGGTISFAMDQELAHEFALQLSDDVVDRRYIETGGSDE